MFSWKALEFKNDGIKKADKKVLDARKAVETIQTTAGNCTE
jgi:hypothetical protein